MRKKRQDIHKSKEKKELLSLDVKQQKKKKKMTYSKWLRQTLDSTNNLCIHKQLVSILPTSECDNQ